MLKKKLDFEIKEVLKPWNFLQSKTNKNQFKKKKTSEKPVFQREVKATLKISRYK